MRRSFGEKPEQFASLAYDAMNALLESICRAGLNRARIHDALAQIYEYDGVTGRMVFDPNQKNVSPMYLGTVRDGKITYRVATMDEAGDRRQETGDGEGGDRRQETGDGEAGDRRQETGDGEAGDRRQETGESCDDGCCYESVSSLCAGG